MKISEEVGQVQLRKENKSFSGNKNFLQVVKTKQIETKPENAFRKIKIHQSTPVYGE